MLQLLKIFFSGLLLLALFIVIGGVFVYRQNKEHYKISSTTPVDKKKKHVNGTGVYFINMDRSKDRLKNIRLQLKGIGFPVHRISAVDGNKLTEKQLKAIFDAESFSANTIEVATKGVVGCYMSHVYAWKKFLDSGYEYALIFEDDILIPDTRLLHNVVLELEQGVGTWDRVGFGRSNSYGAFDRLLKLKVKDLSSVPGVSLFQYLGPNFCTYAYLINRKGATIMLSHALPMKISAEIYQDVVFGGKLSNLYTTEIVRQRGLGFASDIEKSDRIEKSEIKGRLDVRSLLTTKKSALVLYVIGVTSNAIYSLMNYLSIDKS